MINNYDDDACIFSSNRTVPLKLSTCSFKRLTS